MLKLRRVYLPFLVALALCTLVGWTAVGPSFERSAGGAASTLHTTLGRDLESTVEHVDRLFESRWTDEGIVPAEPADELQVLRRLSLALFGSIPSLAEIREFEADARPDRLRRWTVRMIADRRFAEYFAERLAVAFAGDAKQEVPFFTRARFATWLADQLAAGRPYDQMVREMIAGAGPPTTNGAVNFVSAEIVQGEEYANRLAARTARAFLGQRIDCAECHDHPFDRWKQEDFQGLAAHFAQVRTGSIGVEDDGDRQHVVEDRKTEENRVIEPRVPFHSDWVGDHDSRRQRLADWITHRENRRLLRAISNRVWGLVFGRPFVAPIDSIPDPPEAAASVAPGEADATELLDVLSADLREHGGDLRRLVLVIASSRVFRMKSTHPELDTASASELDRLAAAWAVFPLVQLRPEQLARSLAQVSALHPLQADDNVFARTSRELWIHRCVEQYGSLGENEFEERTESIPKTIDRMYSRMTRVPSQSRWHNAAGRIVATAPDHATSLESCYLVCLARRPGDGEREYFVAQLRDASGRHRSRVVEDIFWTLVNSPEFGWNH